MSPQTRRFLVISIVSLHLMGDLVAIPIAYRLKVGDGTGFALFCLFGLLLGQTSLTAAYLAWGCDHWVARWISSCLLVALAWYAVSLGAVSTGDSFEVSSIEQILAVLVAMSFAFVCIPFWVIRAFCQSRFELVQNDQRSAAVSKRQFHVRNLLTWTAAAGIMFAMLGSRIGRAIWASDWSMSRGDWATIAFWMSIWASLCLLIAIPAIWACLGNGGPARRLVGFGIYAAIAVASEWAILRAITGEERLGTFVLGLNFGVLCQVVTCSLLLRICGYRITCRSPKAQQDCGCVARK
jgi:hypothetical protein